MILDEEDSPLTIVIDDFGISNTLLMRLIRALLASPFSGTVVSFTFRTSSSKLIIALTDDLVITFTLISIPHLP